MSANEDRSTLLKHLQASKGWEENKAVQAAFLAYPIDDDQSSSIKDEMMDKASAFRGRLNFNSGSITQAIIDRELEDYISSFKLANDMHHQVKSEDIFDLNGHYSDICLDCNYEYIDSLTPDCARCGAKRSKRSKRQGAKTAVFTLLGTHTPVHPVHAPVTSSLDVIDTNLHGGRRREGVASSYVQNLDPTEDSTAPVSASQEAPRGIVLKPTNFLGLNGLAIVGSAVALLAYTYNDLYTGISRLMSSDSGFFSTLGKAGPIGDKTLLVVGAVGGILFLCWLYRMSAAARAQNPASVYWGPMWVWLSLIPFIHLFAPYLVLRDAERTLRAASMGEARKAQRYYNDKKILVCWLLIHASLFIGLVLLAMLPALLSTLFEQPFLVVGVLAAASVVSALAVVVAVVMQIKIMIHVSRLHAQV